MSMQRRHLREAVEIVGVVSIVASLLLVAWEVRQANGIAAAEIEMQLAQAYNAINNARATSPEFAKLFPKLSTPEIHLITATDNSQMEGLAWHYINVYWSAQIAFDKGVLSRKQLDAYAVDSAWLVDAYPGLHRHLIMIYTSHPGMHGMRVFRPIADLAAQQESEGTDNP